MLKKPFVWDFYSDQPSVITDKAYKKNMRKNFKFDYAKMALLSLFILPLATICIKIFKGLQKPAKSDFYGIGVNLDKGDEQVWLVDELGVKNLLIRLPLWDMQNLDEYIKFALKFKGKNILIAIMQDRDNIENLELFRENLRQIFTKFQGIANEFQIGIAINRLKWGFFAPCEYLNFYKTAQNLRDESFKSIKLIGPSVIDFEFHHNVATLFSLKDVKFDKLSSLLYVDRRGDPKNSQYGIFDLKNKINLLFALVKFSPKTSNEIYITETNYPLKNTAPYAPTSEKECVSVHQYAHFMQEYHDIALKTGKIKRIYWHQLIAPGYGLVDNRDGKLVKMPQFYEYKKMINEDIY
ncbi:hypothetical protein [Campylobacter suis]|uniref:Uncharacterized protein n=1 Tax=Campylobacter suis TaxID=2790657 RepID=A0ABN7K357_9BACT|nr:hypothetical protein [Campylobacter suis]CAD7286470.1 hypothetical protein LMG8286_00303 [Campylobacter suis]